VSDEKTCILLIFYPVLINDTSNEIVNAKNVFQKAIVITYVISSHCVPRRLKRSLAFFIQHKTLFTENK
jgi:hypothetical protein